MTGEQQLIRDWQDAEAVIRAHRAPVREWTPDRRAPGAPGPLWDLLDAITDALEDAGERLPGIRRNEPVELVA